MAVIWHKEQQDSRYEVRSAGNSLRLYTNGVFHSQYNPRQVLSGSVWDLLCIPAFFHPPSTLQNVLVLGVGGGAVIRQLNTLLTPKTITGIELNPIHLQVAKRFFGVESDNVDLIEANAVTWLNDYSGPAFDLIIDDLFGEQDGEPVRAVSADWKWCRLLLKHLSPTGTIVSNFASYEELKTSAYRVRPAITRSFDSAFRFSIPSYGNAVGAFLRRKSSSAQLRARLKSLPGIKASQLGYTVRTL